MYPVKGPQQEAGCTSLIVGFVMCWLIFYYGIWQVVTVEPQ